MAGRATTSTDDRPVSAVHHEGERTMSAVPQAIQPAQTLESLADAWARAKHEEDAANKRRVEIEARILAVAGSRDEGAQTHELADGRKLTVTAKVTRTVDETAWREVMHQVPAELRPIHWVETMKLDMPGLRWLMENKPDVYAIVARAITAKPAKPAISLKVA